MAPLRDLEYVNHFAQHGWRVIGVDRASFGEGFPDTGLFIQADISIGENLASIFQQAQAYTTSLNALINNAALQIAKPLLETSTEEWDAVMASNLRSVFLGVKLAHPLLKSAGGGAIVNVSSVHAVATSANIAAYAASKGGLLALTRAMAIEFAPDNIRVNAILPGAVDTPMLRAGLSRDRHRKTSASDLTTGAEGNGRGTPGDRSEFTSWQMRLNRPS
jgi:NAD(P)-dependent dehydrogenase (short-subunit alcohol dehydrogenase family)